LTEKGFSPLSGELGIPGTSYRLQLGLINEKWAVRLLKGKDVLDSYVFKDEDSSGGFPNQNLIVGYVLRTVAIPNINPHQVMKTTQALVNQAVKNKEQRKVMAPVSETKEVALEKVPDSELRRPKTQGRVKEEGMKSQQELEAETREAFKERVKTKKEREEARVSAVSTLKTTRQLPSIPSEGDQGKAPTNSDSSEFCPFCGKEFPEWKFCPYCGKQLPH